MTGQDKLLNLKTTSMASKVIHAIYNDDDEKEPISWKGNQEQKDLENYEREMKKIKSPIILIASEKFVAFTGIIINS